MYTARLVNFHVYYCNHIIDIGKKKDVFSFYSAYIVANFIDGAALAVLPGDFTEFSHLVPQSGLRIKLKAVLELKNL